jgi:transforming growth factor-beta-induced protein
MKNIKSWKGVFLSAAVLLGMTVFSCKDTNNNTPLPTNTLVDIVSNTASLSYLKAAVIRTNLVKTLTDPGTYTVFAPNNEAFIAAGFPTIASIETADTSVLKPLILYHVLGKKASSTDIPTGSSSYVTVNGKSVFTSKSATGVYVNAIKVITADNQASNGVAHIIGAVLNPPTKNIVQLAQSLTTNPNLSLLVQAILKASTGTTDVASVLSGNGPFTVFAPTNDAFTAIGFDAAKIASTPADDLATILTLHVISGEILSTDLVDNTSATTLNGSSVLIQLPTSGATVKGPGNVSASKITLVNNFATNGVVHIIDQVLLPPTDIMAYLKNIAGPDFSTLRAAIIRLGLSKALTNAGTFTVFAPTNAAFASAGIADSTKIATFDKVTLDSLIRYHVIASKVYKVSDIPSASNTPVVSLEERTVYITKNTAGVFVNGVKVVVADIQANNGVIHVIGRALSQPNRNIVDAVLADPDLSLLKAAVLRASTGSTNVATLLSNPGSFTVFAPTNAAFAATPYSTEAIINATDANALATILKYHVLNVRVFSSDLTAGTVAAALNLNNEALTIGLTPSPSVKGNTNTAPSNIVATDITANNGVIHKIDQVLLP